MATAKKLKPKVPSLTIEEQRKNIAPNLKAEIISGVLIVTPRPTLKHCRTATRVSSKISRSFEDDENGGPGGWVIIIEPEIWIGKEKPIPDIAGWKKHRFEGHESETHATVAPDWVCEIISPSSEKIDRLMKPLIYAAAGIEYYWLIDPIQETLEVMTLKQGKFQSTQTLSGDQKIKAAPFQDIEFRLKSFFG